METEKQKNPFAQGKPAAAPSNTKGNDLHHDFPSWDLVPPHAPVRKGADA